MQNNLSERDYLELMTRHLKSIGKGGKEIAEWRIALRFAFSFNSAIVRDPIERIYEAVIDSINETYGVQPKNPITGMATKEDDNPVSVFNVEPDSLVKFLNKIVREGRSILSVTRSIPKPSTYIVVVLNKTK